MMLLNQNLNIEGQNEACISNGKRRKYKDSMFSYCKIKDMEGTCKRFNTQYATEQVVV